MQLYQKSQAEHELKEQNDGFIQKLEVQKDEFEQELEVQKVRVFPWSLYTCSVVILTW